jgi:nucleotide-binding universal stress UspA family protein
VGVDGTATGRDAVVLASPLGRSTGAELLLIAVVEESLVLLPGPDEVSWNTIQKQARATLAKTRDSLAPQARIVVQTGAVAWRGLESVVRRQHRDLLVIGSGRNGADGQVRLGRDAQELLCDLECPIAIAAHGMRNLHNPGIDRVGVGFDGEPEARAALALAASIAKAAGAELEVLGVVDDRVPGRLTTGQVVLGGEAIVAREVDSLVDRARAAVQAHDVSARVQVSAGNPSEALRSLAAEVDLLVIGSSRSGRAGRLSLGRTGERVSAGSPCPVMIVPRPRDDSSI